MSAIMKKVDFYSGPPLPTFQETVAKELCEDLLKQQETIFLDALRATGLPVDMEFIKSNIECITEEGGKFNHYWYKHGTPDARRIISIEREPLIRYDMPSNFSNNVKLTMEARYY